MWTNHASHSQMVFRVWKRRRQRARGAFTASSTAPGFSPDNPSPHMLFHHVEFGLHHNIYEVEKWVTTVVTGGGRKLVGLRLKMFGQGLTAGGCLLFRRRLGLRSGCGLQIAAHRGNASRCEAQFLRPHPYPHVKKITFQPGCRSPPYLRPLEDDGTIFAGEWRAVYPQEAQ